MKNKLSAFTDQKDCDKDPIWLTTDEASNYLRVSPEVLRNLVSQGKIPYYKLGRSNRYLKSELELIIFSNRGKYYDHSQRA